MTQADLARLCDLVRGVSRLALGVLGVATYLLVRPVVRSLSRRGQLGQQLVTMTLPKLGQDQQHLGHGQASTYGGGQLERGGAQGVTGVSGETE